jgi:hypothetical protein
MLLSVFSPTFIHDIKQFYFFVHIKVLLTNCYGLCINKIKHDKSLPSSNISILYDSMKELFLFKLEPCVAACNCFSVQILKIIFIEFSFMIILYFQMLYCSYQQYFSQTRLSINQYTSYVHIKFSLHRCTELNG